MNTTSAQKPSSAKPSTPVASSSGTRQGPMPYRLVDGTSPPKPQGAQAPPPAIEPDEAAGGGRSRRGIKLPRLPPRAATLAGKAATDKVPLLDKSASPRVGVRTAPASERSPDLDAGTTGSAPARRAWGLAADVPGATMSDTAYPRPSAPSDSVLAPARTRTFLGAQSGAGGKDNARSGSTHALGGPAPGPQDAVTSAAPDIPPRTTPPTRPTAEPSTPSNGSRRAPGDEIRMTAGAGQRPLSVRTEDGSSIDVQNTYNLAGDARLHSFPGGRLAYDDGTAATPRLLDPVSDVSGLPRTREATPAIYRNPQPSSLDASSHLAVLNDGTLQRLRENSSRSREFVDVPPAVDHARPPTQASNPPRPPDGGAAPALPPTRPQTYGLKGGVRPPQPANDARKVVLDAEIDDDGQLSEFGYTNNYQGRGEEALVLHSANRALLLLGSEVSLDPASGELVVDEAGARHLPAGEFARVLRREHDIDLYSQTCGRSDPLLLVTCEGAFGIAQDLANEVKRPVIASEAQVVGDLEGIDTRDYRVINGVARALGEDNQSVKWKTFQPQDEAALDLRSDRFFPRLPHTTDVYATPQTAIHQRGEAILSATRNVAAKLQNAGQPTGSNAQLYRILYDGLERLQGRTAEQITSVNRELDETSDELSRLSYAPARRAPVQDPGRVTDQHLARQYQHTLERQVNRARGLEGGAQSPHLAAIARELERVQRISDEDWVRLPPKTLRTMKPLLAEAGALLFDSTGFATLDAGIKTQRAHMRQYLA